MVRLFNHWFASNTLMQIAFDALLLFLSVVLAVALFGGVFFWLLDLFLLWVTTRITGQGSF